MCSSDLQSLKDKSICRSCYWAYPEGYTHIGMCQVRRVDLLWEGDDVRVYEALQQRAISLEKEIPELIKEIINREIKTDNDN